MTVPFFRTLCNVAFGSAVGVGILTLVVGCGERDVIVIRLGVQMFLLGVLGLMISQAVNEIVAAIIGATLELKRVPPADPVVTRPGGQTNRKTCVLCKHLLFDADGQGILTCECLKKRWNLGDQEISDARFCDTMVVADTCDEFEPAAFGDQARGIRPNTPKPMRRGPLR
jgi:hypothetical protein